MKANGEDIKTIQELLCHSNSKVTASVYTQEVCQRSGLHKQTRADGADGKEGR